MTTVNYACIFVRATADRLKAAERLVLALPHLLDDALVSCDLRYRAEAGFLGVEVRLRPGVDAAHRERLAFWTARAGGRAVALDGLPVEDRARLDGYLVSPTHERREVPTAALFDTSGQFFTEAGAPADRRRNAAERPRLVMDVGGPGWDGVRYEPAHRELFVAAPIAPPVGDAIPLFLRVPGEKAPVEAHAIVTAVRSAVQSGPGAPAGYTLVLEDPPAALERALGKAQRGAGEAGLGSRAAPRFQVSAPVKVLVPDPPTPRPSPAEPAPAHATIEYATDQELAADYIQNLSQGGAFVRTASAAPVGTPVELQLKLPNGVELRARATVASVTAKGMGVRFVLSAEADAVLSAAMAHISARPRRALVVDDDALVCRMLGDALRERGFEVITASDAGGGLSTLAEELLALDLLVTDVVMPGMNGEGFVRLIREQGGEADLAIVCMSSKLGDGVEQRLEAAGADAVLDKALGPELIAQAADAVLERKRLLSQGG